MASLIAAVLARAQGFLVEPPVPEGRVAAAPPVERRASVQVAVTGLSRGSGATTIAVGLAHALAVPGARSAHLVSLRAGVGPPGRGRVASWDLPPALDDPAEIAAYGATLARIAAGEGAAAVVWDVRADDSARAARVMEASDAVVCVADGSAEPALCGLVCELLGERHGPVLLVANRVRDEEAWTGAGAVVVPESRVAALMLARGRAPGGAAGEALARVAALVEERAGTHRA